jgi:hypothetical protein
MQSVTTNGEKKKTTESDANEAESDVTALAGKNSVPKAGGVGPDTSGNAESDEETASDASELRAEHEARSGGSASTSSGGEPPAPATGEGQKVAENLPKLESDL